jgi:hypothetical protein
MKAHAANLQHRAVHGPSRDPKHTRQAAAVDCRSQICRKPGFDLVDNVKALLKRTRAFVQLHIKGSIAGLDLKEVLPSFVIDRSCVSALRIGANRRRTNWRALSPAFAQEGNLFTIQTSTRRIQTSTRRKRALNVRGFNACGTQGDVLGVAAGRSRHQMDHAIVIIPQIA